MQFSHGYIQGDGAVDGIVSLIKFSLFLLLVLALIVLAIPILILNLFFKGFLAAFFRTVLRFYGWCSGKRFGGRSDSDTDATVSPPPYKHSRPEHVTITRE